MRTAAWISAVVLGALMVVGGVVTWTVVSSTLADQRITVADDADCLAGDDVGKTYAELDREDPLRDTAMNSAFLQASLFTSVVAFGVAAMAIAMGLLFILIGLGIRDVRPLRDPGAA